MRGEPSTRRCWRRASWRRRRELGEGLDIRRRRVAREEGGGAVPQHTAGGPLSGRRLGALVAELRARRAVVLAGLGPAGGGAAGRPPAPPGGRGGLPRLSGGLLPRLPPRPF